jgi:mRNA deadenylase 3'-5' endonuclease subunit Ccr4
MHEVSKEIFDTFYENNLGVLNRTPKFKSKEVSITWVYENTKNTACMIVESTYNKCNFYIDE